MSTNFLSGLNFEMVLTRLPSTSFMVQGLQLPGISSNPVMKPTPFVTLPIPGDHADFSPLNVRFILDENMSNYLEIYDWMIALYFPDDGSQFKEISQRVPGVPGITSDISLNVLDFNKKSIKSIQFYEAFPTNLSELDFAYTESDVQYITCTVTFYYRKFHFIT